MKRIYYFVCVCIAILIMTSCGKNEKKPENALSVPAANWRNEGFLVGQKTEGQELWISNYAIWQHDTYHTEKSKVYQTFELGSYENKIYRMNSIVMPPDMKAIKWVLEVYDTSTMKSMVTEFLPEQVGIADMDVGLLGGMDIIGPQEFVYQMIDYAIDQEGRLTQNANCFIYSDLKQNMQRTDLLSAYKEKGLIEERYDTIMASGECICDSEGNSYVRTVNKQTSCPIIYVWDKSGAFLMECMMPEECIVEEPFILEGDLIFPVIQQYDNSTHMIWLDVNTGMSKTLAILEDEQITQVYGVQGNCVYYKDKEGIVRWDIVSGIRKQIFCFEQNGINKIYDTMLVLRDEKTPILRMYGTINGEFKDWLVVLSEKKIERKESIRIANLVEPFDRVEGSVVIANRDNPNYHYIYEEPIDSQKEEYRTKIFAELVAGNGPDVLYVTLEDMENLKKQGVLLDLNTLLSGEILDGVLPGAIELGTIDNELVGLPAEISAISMVVSQKIGAEKNWTLDEIISFMESGKLNGRLVQSNLLFAPRAMLGTILEYSLDNCFLIDWKKKQSHFEDERFLKLLEYSRASGSKVEEIQGDPLGEMGNRMKIVGLSYKWEVSQFVGTRDTEDGYFIGLPSECGNGNYLESSGVLVVKKGVTDVSAVSAYLECFLGKEVQNIGEELSVLKLSTEDIVINKQTEESWWKKSDGTLYSLLMFEDGTTSLHEAKKLLEICVPMPKGHDAIYNIIMEEVQAYYAGAKSAKEVADIIDNRTQLYLDEDSQ